MTDNARCAIKAENRVWPSCGVGEYRSMHTSPAAAERDPFPATLWLAACWSVVAALTTVLVASFTAVSQPALVLGVMAFGYVASWVVTDRVRGEGLFAVER